MPLSPQVKFIPTSEGHHPETGLEALLLVDKLNNKIG